MPVFPCHSLGLLYVWEYFIHHIALQSSLRSLRRSWSGGASWRAQAAMALVPIINLPPIDALPPSSLASEADLLLLLHGSSPQSCQVRKGKQCDKFFIRAQFFENTSKIRVLFFNKNTSKMRAKIRVKLKFLRQKCVNQHCFCFYDISA